MVYIYDVKDEGKTSDPLNPTICVNPSFSLLEVFVMCCIVKEKHSRINVRIIGSGFGLRYVFSVSIMFRGGIKVRAFLQK